LAAITKCQDNALSEDCVEYAKLDYEYLLPNLQSYEEINNFFISDILSILNNAFSSEDIN
jgi:hypothetical protein